MSILTRFVNVFRSRALEQEFEEELRFHLAERTAAHRQYGMNQADADAAARDQFGNVDEVKYGMREVRMMNTRVVGAFAAGLMVGVLAAGLAWSPESFLRGSRTYRPGQDGASTPVLLQETKPEYTADAMRAKIAGTVLMECVVQPSGACEDVRVTRSLDPGLDNQAINALRSWRFQPGEREGKPVPVIVTIEMAFTLRS